MEKQRKLEPVVVGMGSVQNELVLYVVLIKLASEALKRSYNQYQDIAFTGIGYNPLRQRLRVKLTNAYAKLIARTEYLCNEVDEGVIQAMVAAAPLMQQGDEGVLQEVIEALQKYKDE